MFSGGKELFIGLAPEQWVTKQSERSAPVLRFDISTIAATTSEDIKLSLREMIYHLAYDFALNIRSQTLGRIVIDLIRQLQKQRGQVVILIDEYDKPILDNLSNLKSASDMCEVLRSFYTVLKSCDEYLIFVLITVISKFSKIGVFSAMNNLEDTSNDRHFGDIADYTQDELEAFFADRLHITAGNMNISHDELFLRLKDYYYGFSFDDRTRLYNLLSNLNV